jgi:hypothetical protein
MKFNPQSDPVVDQGDQIGLVCSNKKQSRRLEPSNSNHKDKELSYRCSFPLHPNPWKPFPDHCNSGKGIKEINLFMKDIYQHSLMYNRDKQQATWWTIIRHIWQPN